MTQEKKPALNNKMTNEELQEFFDEITDKKVKKLMDVGFTEEQAKVILEVTKESAMLGGFF
jgi:hypothetical protein